jgi:biotin carboxylase
MEVPTADDLRVAVDAIGLPVVIKPVDRSGARGVFLARDHSRLEEFYALALSESFSGRVMVEEYVPGPQISTETIMSAGRGVTPGFVDRNYDQLERFAPSVIENGGWAPSQLEGADRQTVEDLVVRASLALGIETGVTKGDVVIGPDGPMIIEMAARLSGGDFSESLVPLSTGVDYIAVAVDLATGIAPDLDCLVRTATQSVANRYFFPEPGVLMSIAGLDEARAQQWVRKLATWYEVGDVVPPVDSHAKRFGVFVVVGADRAEVDARVRWVYDTVKIETRPVAHE